MANESAKNEQEFFPEPYPLTAEQRAAALAKAKAAFSAADLQRFTEVEEGIPFEKVIEELEQIQREAARGHE